MTNRNQFLRHARERSGLLGREVAYKLGLSESRVYRLEGEATVTEDTLRKYEEAGLISRPERIALLIGDEAAA